MAQINYSREKLENMSQRTIKQAQAILEKYSKDKNASQADRQGWEATSQQLDDVYAKIDQAYNLAKSYGIDFEGKSKDLVTLAEIYQLMDEQIHDKGASAGKVGNLMDQINDLPVGASDKAKFQAWAKDKNLSGKLTTGLLGFGVAEMALSALGVGKAAIAAGTASTATGAVLGSALPGAFTFLGNAITGLWTTSPIGFCAIAIPLVMKAWPHVKSFMNKHGKAKEKGFAAELDQISAQNKDGVRKQKETPSQDKENQNEAGQLSDIGVEPSDFEQGLREYNAIEDGMDKLAELQSQLDELTEELQGEVAELESCYRRNSRNPKQLEAEAEEHKIRIKEIEDKINDVIKEIKAAKQELNQISSRLSAKMPKTKKVQAFIENFQNRIDDKEPETVAQAKTAVGKYKEVYEQAVKNEKEDKAREAAAETPTTETPTTETPTTETPTTETPTTETPTTETPTTEAPTTEAPVAEAPDAGIAANVRAAADDFRGSLKGQTSQQIKKHKAAIEAERARIEEGPLAGRFSALFDISEDMLDSVIEQRREIAEKAQGRHKNPAFNKSNAPYIDNAEQQLLEDLGAQKE